MSGRQLGSARGSRWRWIAALSGVALLVAAQWLLLRSPGSERSLVAGGDGPTQAEATIVLDSWMPGSGRTAMKGGDAAQDVFQETAVGPHRDAAFGNWTLRGVVLLGDRAGDAEGAWIEVKHGDRWYHADLGADGTFVVDTSLEHGGEPGGLPGLDEVLVSVNLPRPHEVVTIFCERVAVKPWLHIDPGGTTLLGVVVDVLPEASLVEGMAVSLWTSGGESAESRCVGTTELDADGRGEIDIPANVDVGQLRAILGRGKSDWTLVPSRVDLGGFDGVELRVSLPCAWTEVEVGRTGPSGPTVISIDGATGTITDLELVPGSRPQKFAFVSTVGAVVIACQRDTSGSRIWSVAEVPPSGAVTPLQIERPSRVGAAVAGRWMLERASAADEPIHVVALPVLPGWLRSAEALLEHPQRLPTQRFADGVLDTLGATREFGGPWDFLGADLVRKDGSFFLRPLSDPPWVLVAWSPSTARAASLLVTTATEDLKWAPAGW